MHRPSPINSRRGAIALAAGAGIALLLAAPLKAFGDCRPNHSMPSIILGTMGPCSFDPEELHFSGTPVEQTACLIRPVKPWGKLGPVLSEVPKVLAERVGQSRGLPTRGVLAGYLIAHDIEPEFAAHLSDPVTRANNNDPTMPVARYFVIHDTSGPFLGVNFWPKDIDTSRKINNLAGHRCEDGWESAHVFINRTGAMMVGHELNIPWRATKFERAMQFGLLLRGLFLHTEMIQPRRGVQHVVRIKRRHHRARWVRRGSRHDILAPTPGFTAEQYDRLALVYVIASTRAGHWLIPAFHAVIDGDILNGHDDPQNFELAKFTGSLQLLLDELERRQKALALAMHDRRQAEPGTAVGADRNGGPPIFGPDRVFVP